MKRWIVTMSGAGFLPASGTWASLLTCLLLWPVVALVPQPGRDAVAALGVLGFSALCVGLGPWAIAQFHDSDPGELVLDEGAGICLTLLLLPQAMGWPAAGKMLVVVFVAFRIFDIWKPPPLHRLERLPAGWGILTDDLAAAVYANILCQIVVRLIAPSFFGSS